MMRRFLGLGAVALFTAWTAVGSAQDYNVRLGNPAGAPTPIGVVVVNGPVTQAGGCSACAAAVPASSCGCKTAQLAFQPCACDAGARVVTVGGTSCASGGCATGGCATGDCASCGCGLIAGCAAKPRAYCQPRPVVIPNPCACATNTATSCSACAPGTCASCAAASPCSSGCSTSDCGCAAEHRPMFPIFARLARILSFDAHSNTGACRSCNACSTCATGSCASGSCAGGSCSANAGVVLSTPVAAAPAAPTYNVVTTGATLPAPATLAPYSATPVIGNGR